MGMIENLEGMLQRGQDNALLRFSLGNAYFKEKQWAVAIEHFAGAVEQDPGYSAAWKQYGKSLLQAGQADRALEVLRQGIEVAEVKGDVQAVKEMQVFLKRAGKQRDNH